MAKKVKKAKKKAGPASKKRTASVPVKKAGDFVPESIEDVKEFIREEQEESTEEEKEFEEKIVDNNLSIILYAIFFLMLLFIFIIILRAKFYP